MDIRDGDQTLMAEFGGKHKQRWNLEQLLVFLVVMLWQEPGVIKYAKICTLLASRLKMWRVSKYTTLMMNVECGGEGVNHTTTRHHYEEDEQVAHKFNAMVLAGKVQSTVRCWRRIAAPV